jgi:hypothetical protein
VCPAISGWLLHHHLRSSYCKLVLVRLGLDIWMFPLYSVTVPDKILCLPLLFQAEAKWHREYRAASW